MSDKYLSIDDLHLNPKPGKEYWKNGQREWREEFIYFLMVDRFHDDHSREPLKSDGKSKGFGTPDQLRAPCGGTLKGITRHLDYIKDLGCTALWLSPVFENNPESYHGYDIRDYTRVDPRFGTMKDLADLVDAAHSLNIRVFLDIVLHHSGNNWDYPDGYDYFYYNGITFPFGKWRYEDKPLPHELRNPELYWRKGQIRNFDSYPETREGDFYGSKTFRNDDSPEGLYAQDLLTRLHCYWIRETDVDGFRLDAVKHMGEKSLSHFCSQVREYAYKLGKRNFFLFGELVGPDEMYNNYIGPKTSILVDDTALYYGLNSVLDFPLYHVLADVILGHSTPEKLIHRYESLRKTALERGEYGEFLVTFIDNHDQVGQIFKKRFGFDATAEQIVAGVGFLLCALGTPCIYYGTEQGFSGGGQGDWHIRESMFNLADESTNALNKDNPIYREIAAIAAIRLQYSALKFGRMYMREYSSDGKDFYHPFHHDCMLTFSRILFKEEVVIVYNDSTDNEDEEYICVDRHLNPVGSVFTFIYGSTGKVHVLSNDDQSRHFIKVKLQPLQFVILTNGR